MNEIELRDRKKYIKAIKKSFLFSEADDSIIKDFIINGKGVLWQTYHKGETIYDYNNYRECLCMILRGKVSVRKNKNGRVLLNTLKEGNAFGGAILFSDSGSFIAGVKAERECTVLFIPKETMIEIMKSSFEVNMNYIKYLSDSLVFLNKRLDVFTAGSAEERVREYINEACKNNGSTDEMSMTEMSEYLALGRATLYRILDDMQQRGEIRRFGRKIFISKER